MQNLPACANGRFGKFPQTAKIFEKYFSLLGKILHFFQANINLFIYVLIRFSTFFSFIKFAEIIIQLIFCVLKKWVHYRIDQCVHLHDNSSQLHPIELKIYADNCLINMSIEFEDETDRLYHCRLTEKFPYFLYICKEEILFVWVTIR